MVVIQSQLHKAILLTLSWSSSREVRITLGFPRLRYTQSSSPHIFVSFLSSTHLFLHRLLLAGHSSFSGLSIFCRAMMVRSMVVTKMQAQRVLTNLDVDLRPCVYLSPLFWIDPSIHRRLFFLASPRFFHGQDFGHFWG